MTVTLGSGTAVSARFWTVSQPTGTGTVTVDAWRCDVDASGSPVALTYIEPNYAGGAHLSDLGRTAIAQVCTDLGIAPAAMLDYVLRTVPG